MSSSGQHGCKWSSSDAPLPSTTGDGQADDDSSDLNSNNNVKNNNTTRKHDNNDDDVKNNYDSDDIIKIKKQNTYENKNKNIITTNDS